MLPLDWASCTKDLARRPWAGGVNAGWPVTTVVQVVAVWVACDRGALSRAGWPTPFGSAALGSCPTIVSELGTASVLLRVMVRPVVLAPAAAVYGTVISGGCQRLLVAVVPTACAVPLVWVQVAPPLAAGVPVP